MRTEKSRHCTYTSIQCRHNPQIEKIGTFYHVIIDKQSLIRCIQQRYFPQVLFSCSWYQSDRFHCQLLLSFTLTICFTGTYATGNLACGLTAKSCIGISHTMEFLAVLSSTQSDLVRIIASHGSCVILLRLLGLKFSRHTW